MKPLKIEFQAFGPYAGYECVDFEKIALKGLFLVCGKTGTGKTMILDAMTFALFGKSSGNGRDDFSSMRCTKADDNTPTFVRFEFENNGKVYLFERRLTKKRVNYSEEYSASVKNSDGGFEPMFENAKAKNLNEKAEEIIGLNYSQFVQVIILPQGKFEKLLTSGSDEKEKILTSIFGEEKWQSIADIIFEKASAKKEEVRSIKETIEKSLNEEECGSMAELCELIESKKTELNDKKTEYENSEYEKKIKELNEALVIYDRFRELEKTEKYLGELADKEQDIKTSEIRIVNAKKAEAVAAILRDVEESKDTLNDRNSDYEKAVNDASKRKEELSEITNLYKEHLSLEKENEEKKNKIAKFDAKKSDYENIDKLEKALKEEKALEKKAKDEVSKASDKMESYKPVLEKLVSEFKVLKNEQNELFDRYLAGITGEIASTLTDGEACPVCGSREHPCKAIISDGNVTRQQVDIKKEECERKDAEIEKNKSLSEQAKIEYDKKKESYVNLSARNKAEEEKIAGIRESLIPGIESLEDLVSKISLLQEEIEKYNDRKLFLETEEKTQKELVVEANTKIETTKKEVEKENKLLMTLEEKLNSAILTNGFESVESVKEVMLSADDIETMNQDIADYYATVKLYRERFEKMSKDLQKYDKSIMQDEENIREKIEEAERLVKEYTAATSVLDNEIIRLTKKQGQLLSLGEGIEEKIKQADEDMLFAKKLRGDTGTSLQRYVLGIMFSSVVSAANKMLEMVHGGRYRLFRTDDMAQNTKKRGLELKVYDKYSEEHEGRFVSTLSGGEKFLASLALSIGMSTVAQKSGIKIEALFIDEGFGSLDEDSIGDAMNILNSIQEANGLVGIISHVQLLQDRIPTKLKVEEVDKGSRIVQSIG